MLLYLSSFLPRLIGAKSYADAAPLLKQIRTLAPYDPVVKETYDSTLRHKKYFKDVMLDSGVFAFYNLLGKNTNKRAAASALNWAKYIYEYTALINTYKIDKFFELDADALVGLEKVKEFRRRIEHITGKQCIPVWHPGRGIAEFEREIEEYPYVAIGAKGFTRAEYLLSTLPLINKAHEKGVKVHGMGVGIQVINRQIGRYNVKLPFDSVDFSSWINGCKYGLIHKFVGDQFVTVYKDARGIPNGYKELNLENIKEFIKASNYMEAQDAEN